MSGVVDIRSFSATGSGGREIDYQPSWHLKQVPIASNAAGDRSEAPVLVSRQDHGLGQCLDRRFHDIFEGCCARLGAQSGWHAAVDYGGVTFSYAALYERANRLARFLLSRGIKSGDRIAFLMDRSIDCYALVLAASKIDATYVPLDASFPVDRVAFMIKDSAVTHVLTLQAFRPRFADCEAAVTVLEDCYDEIAEFSAAPFVHQSGLVDSDPLAYIIYTSGSTGQPKGVPIRHSSICNFLHVASRLYGYRQSDRVYQGMTLAFDFAVEEVWVPLAVGATLVPAPSQSKLLGNDLSDFLVAGRVTALCCVPTMLATLEAPLDQIRLLLVSGEACPADIIAPWLVPERRVLNAYGPTETTVTATWTIMQPGKSVTIGGPLPGYTIIIVDPDTGCALGPGEAGEICIAGVGLCDDYLHRPDQSKRAFMADFLDLPDNPSKRFYRSGDLGRITGSCEIEYLGRIDTQVKIRGYRIELEEIETVIRGSGRVGQAVVVPWDPGSGVELAAYCTPAQPGAAIDFAQINARLREALPSYMVPAFYEQLDELPLLASTKVDRKSLPSPTGGRLISGDARYVAPRNAREAELALMLADVLKLEQVSVEADFFDELGADSLKLAQYVTLIRKQLGIRRISMRQLYQETSIAKLAALVDEVAARETGAAAEKASLEKSVAPVNDFGSAKQRATDGQHDDSQVAGPMAADHASLPTRPKRAADADQSARHVPTMFAMVATSVAQIIVSAALLFVTIAASLAAYRWSSEATGAVEVYLRVVASASLVFLATSTMLIAVKWLAVGRFTTRPIPIYSLRYLGFWIARRAIQANPMNLFAGTPVYNFYLRLLGLKIGSDAVVLSPPPVCTDLISIGANTVIRQDAVFPGYTGQNGYLYPGRIEIGSNVLICEATVLDINTKIGDGAQLGTTSALLEGQSIPAGAAYQGSPAQPTTVNFDRTEPRTVSTLRKAVFTAAQLTGLFFISLPLTALIAVLLVALGLTAAGTDIEQASPIDAGTLLVGSASIYFAGIAMAIVTILTVPRFLNLFVVAEVAHPLYGTQYELARSIARLSNSRLLNTIFGDSSMIVYWLSAVGYDLSKSTQTGSNFGVDQRHHSPFLCSFDRNTLVSDGLLMMNMETSATSFIMRRVSMPPDTYVGNVVHYPADSKLGPNCLIATKAAIPLDGPILTDVGILGSPAFQIPRSVARDTKFDHLKAPGTLELRLAMKLRSNLVTLGLYLLRSWMLVLAGLGLGLWSAELFETAAPGGLMVAAAAGTVSVLFFILIGALLSILCERAVCGFKKLEPRYCSLYDQAFWDHERYWKLNYNTFIAAFDGTAMKPFFLRLQGARIGRRLFDDGGGLTEPSLVEIGDDCMLNYRSELQAHSLEDGTFKSDRIRLGNNCTIGTNGFVHYGTTLHDSAILEADAFLMKGSVLEIGTRWSGNPAQDTTSVQDKRDTAEKGMLKW